MLDDDTGLRAAVERVSALVDAGDRDAMHLLALSHALMQRAGETRLARNLSMELHPKNDCFVSIDWIRASLPDTVATKPLHERIHESTDSYLGRQVSDRLFADQPKTRLSHRRTAHVLAMSNVQSELAKVVAEVFTRALTSTPMATEAVVTRLGTIWRKTVLPLIEGEQRAILSETEDISRFMLELSKVELSLRHDGSRAAHATLLAVTRTSHAMIQRLRDTHWSTAKAALFPSDAMVEQDAFLEWLRPADGASLPLHRLRMALLDDYRALAKISAESPNSVVWHGLEMVDQLTSAGLRIQPPVFTGVFATDSGRVYAQFVPESTNFGLCAVQVFFVVRNLLQRGWLSTNYLSDSFAKSIVGDLVFEHANLTRRASNKMVEAAYEMLHVVVTTNDTFSIARALIARAATVTTQADTSAGSADATAPTAAPAAADPFVWPGEAVRDTIVLARDPHFLPKKRHVHWVQIVEYLTLEGLLEHLSKGIDQRTARLNGPMAYRAPARVVCIDTELLLRHVSQSLISLADDPDLASLALLLRNATIRPRLDLRVAAALKKLTVCAHGAHSAEKHNFVLDFAFDSDSPKSQKNIRFGGESTHSLYFVHNCTVRILGLLQECWPMPSSLKWAPAKLPRLAPGASTDT